MSKRKQKNIKGEKKAAPKDKTNYKKQILGILRKSPNKPLNHKQIASRLGVDHTSGRNQIKKNITKLYEKRKIDSKGRGKYTLAGDPDYYEGAIDMTTRGDAYVIVEELEQDIHISHHKLHRALDGDRVQVFCYANSRKRKPEGEVIKILKRKKTDFVGVLRLKKTFGFVEMSNPKMYTDIFVPRSKIKN